VPALEALLDHPNSGVRFRAACALARMEAETNPKVLAGIGPGLNIPPDPVMGNDPDFAQKSQLQRELVVENLMALETLEKIGPAAGPLLPDLRQFAASKKDHLLQQMAFRLIGRLDPDARRESAQIDSAVRLDEERKQWQEKLRSDTLTIDDLIGALKDDQRVLLAAMRLGQMGDAAKPAVPAMIAALRGRENDVQNQIIEAVRSIDPSAKIDLVERSVVGAAIDAALNAAFASAGSRSEAQNQTLMKSLQTDTNNRALIVNQWTYGEMTDFANMLVAQDASVRRSFVDKAVEMDGRLKSLFAEEH
jgi:hypothetical protein